MKQDERTPFDRALQIARVSAYAPGEYVEQENFMLASEIRELAVEAGVGPGVAVLDLCCGVAGPGRFITRELGCTYTGVDFSASAIDLARERASDLGCTFEVALVPPVPEGPFDVITLLETMLAFPDKGPLLDGVVAALAPDGRFAFTLEEGRPLTAAEGDLMPDADTVWLTPLSAMLDELASAGLQVRWQVDCSAAHRQTVDALIASFAEHRDDIATEIGPQAIDELLTAHRLWSQWLASGRVRKFAFVTERTSQV